ncbi:hypothetical protein BDW02DRAFT_20649 [Decorospora gaudefroyi]|uniref:Uncharacterized protein n=1 Tax=Decorospora gaudefroyi TaxID=184978 RepID=A0A6A5K3D9_9PLEO|nr:hypothetical protein BDW02DRAFT_20649 [Decorospora gaudefroyi]
MPASKRKSEASLWSTLSMSSPKPRCRYPTSGPLHLNSHRDIPCLSEGSHFNISMHRQLVSRSELNSFYSCRSDCALVCHANAQISPTMTNFATGPRSFPLRALYRQTRSFTRYVPTMMQDGLSCSGLCPSGIDLR